ncbi:DUF4229 domain-containing protein [Homoserinibacter sp. YIM 151385]|uniref:DUF4229 domain-containing protein n=1 Tax=Homoserinibacter sp. YIM 151385 TaxID=2985506 RepID=UPI0022F09769|nr:DUF4229 domain-containing protein [Homoserinibacter sp. YIM 151385]WBU37002.1 DUF4229 domain-containing protein [Homoserinibacter sp. YIM 151385]
MPTWVRYTIIRLGLFAVIFAGLLLMQVPFVIAAIVAAVCGFAIAYIFFRGQRDEIARQLAARRTRDQAAAGDERAEDV